MPCKPSLDGHLTAREIKHFNRVCTRNEPEMKLPNGLSREAAVNGLKNLGKLRMKINHSTIITFSALLLILSVAFTIRMLPVRWEIQTGALHLSEFDPYYQYSLTNYMVKNGLISPYWPTFWIDYQRWAPYGINMGSSLSSLPLTAALSYGIITALGINVDLMSFCALFPVMLGTLAVLIMYFIGKDVGGRAVGLLAALFLALNPAVIQRSNLGWFDTEVTMFAFLLFIFFFLRAIEEERPIGSSVMYSLGAAAALAYFVMGWGAAYYLVGLSVLFVFVLLLMKRYSRRLFLAYSLTFGLGLLISVVNPDISTRYVINYPVLPVAGVFVLLCLSEIVRNLTSAREKLLLVVVFLTVIIGGFAAMWTMGYIGNVAGKFFEVINPFVRSSDPLVESVAEHQISAWGSIYYDLGIGILFFFVGVFFVSRNLSTKNLFLLVFGLTSLYFASSIVRLLFIFGFAFAIVAAVGIVGMLKPFVTLLKEPTRIVTKKKFGLEHVGREFSGTAVFLIFLVLMTNLAFSPQSGGAPNVYRQAYSPVTVTVGSLPIVPNEPVKEWLDMCQYLNNLQQSTTVVDSWWDYGYWLSMLGNVTSLADNATINSTQIENVGFTFMANETESVKMLKLYNAGYILVFTTLSLQQQGNTQFVVQAGYGDEGKWSWMARISGKSKHESDGLWPGWDWTDESTFGEYTNTTTYWPNNWAWNQRGMNTTIYKLMTWARSLYCNANGVVDPDAGNVTQPQYFEEEYVAGLTLAPPAYGNLVPLVALYRVKYPEG